MLELSLMLKDLLDLEVDNPEFEFCEDSIPSIFSDETRHHNRIASSRFANSGSRSGFLVIQKSYPVLP